MLLRLHIALVLTFLLVPILVVVLFSFHSSNALAFPFQGFSLRWYAEIFSNPILVSGIINSVIVALVTSVVVTLLGSMAALAFVRLPASLRGALGMISFAPIALPGLFLGISLLILFAMLHIQLSATTVVIAHVLFTLPFFIVAARARVEMFDLSLEEAARDLGATPWQSFRLVTLPIISPTLVGGAIMTFALSFDEFIITSFVIGTDSTAPMVLWSMMRRTVSPLINSVSTLALLVSLISVLASAYFIRLQEKRLKSFREAAT